MLPDRQRRLPVQLPGHNDDRRPRADNHLHLAHAGPPFRAGRFLRRRVRGRGAPHGLLAQRGAHLLAGVHQHVLPVQRGHRRGVHNRRRAQGGLRRRAVHGRGDTLADRLLRCGLRDLGHRVRHHVGVGPHEHRVPGGRAAAGRRARGAVQPVLHRAPQAAGAVPRVPAAREASQQDAWRRAQVDEGWVGAHHRAFVHSHVEPACRQPQGHRHHRGLCIVLGDPEHGVPGGHRLRLRVRERRGPCCRVRRGGHFGDPKPHAAGRWRGGGRHRRSRP